MTGIMALMIIGVFVVVVFDYTNGMQDAANMLATIVTSRPQRRFRRASFCTTLS
jgi:PiT family inorganic phosphate transporter